MRERRCIINCHRGWLEDTHPAASTGSRVSPNLGVFVHQVPTTDGLKAAPRGGQFSGMSNVPHGQAQSLAAREHCLEVGCVP